MKFTPVLSPDVAVLILIFPPRRVVLGVPPNKSAVLEIAELVNKEVSLLSLKNLTLKSLIKSLFSMLILKEVHFQLVSELNYQLMRLFHQIFQNLKLKTNFVYLELSQIGHLQ